MFLKSHFYEKTSCYYIFAPLFPSFLQVTIFKGFPGGSDAKECLQFRRPGFDPWVWEDTLEKGMATQSSTLAWRIP